MEPVSNLGKFGRLLLVIVGIILIVMGTAAIVDQRPPKDSAETTATITDFRTISDGGDRSSGRMVTIVAYTAEGKEYRNIELGQYEAQWKKGDHISIQNYENIQNSAGEVLNSDAVTLKATGSGNIHVGYNITKYRYDNNINMDYDYDGNYAATSTMKKNGVDANGFRESVSG